MASRVKALSIVDALTAELRDRLFSGELARTTR